MAAPAVATATTAPTVNEIVVANADSTVASAGVEFHARPSTPPTSAHGQPDHVLCLGCRA